MWYLNASRTSPESVCDSIDSFLTDSGGLVDLLAGGVDHVIAGGVRTDTAWTSKIDSSRLSVAVVNCNSVGTMGGMDGFMTDWPSRYLRTTICPRYNVMSCKSETKVTRIDMVIFIWSLPSATPPASCHAPLGKQNYLSSHPKCTWVTRSAYPVTSALLSFSLISRLFHLRYSPSLAEPRPQPHLRAPSSVPDPFDQTKSPLKHIS